MKEKVRMGKSETSETSVCKKKTTCEVYTPQTVLECFALHIYMNI